MLILVTYDVETTTPEGQKRLRNVAKVCLNYGQRVQNSVFECVIDFSQYTKFKLELMGIIDSAKDSLRIYNLGNHYTTKVDIMGINHAHNLEGELII